MAASHLHPHLVVPQHRIHINLAIVIPHPAPSFLSDQLIQSSKEVNLSSIHGVQRPLCAASTPTPRPTHTKCCCCLEGLAHTHSGFQPCIIPLRIWCWKMHWVWNHFSVCCVCCLAFPWRASTADGGQHWHGERNCLQVRLVLLWTAGKICSQYYIGVGKLNAICAQRHRWRFVTVLTIHIPSASQPTV